MNTMDKQKIGFIGALAIVLVAVVGGIYLAAKGVAVPAWLASLLAVIGPAFAWYAKPPGSDGPKPPSVPPLPLLLVLLVGLPGCASWWSRTPQHVGDVAAILACVAEKTEAGHDATSVALACGLENADRVVDLLKVQRQLEAKHAAKKAAP